MKALCLGILSLAATPAFAQVFEPSTGASAVYQPARVVTDTLTSLNDTVEIELFGRASVGLVWATTNFDGVVTPEVSADGSTWQATKFLGSTGQLSTVTFTGGSATADQSILIEGATVRVRVKATTFTAGTLTVVMVAASASSNLVRGFMGIQDDEGDLAAVMASAPAGTEQGVVTRNIPSGTQPVSGTVTLGAGSADAGNVNIEIGSAVLSATNPVPTRPSDGAAFIDPREIEGQNNLRPLYCDKSVSINTATINNVQLVALSGSTVVYVCGWDVIADGTVGVQLISGTGTACGTGETDLTGVYSFQVREGKVAYAGGGNIVTKTAAGEALCIELSAAIQINGVLSYAQF